MHDVWKQINKFRHIFVVDDQTDWQNDEKEEICCKVFDQVERVFVDRKDELEDGLPGEDGHDQQGQQASLLQDVGVVLAVFCSKRTKIVIFFWLE